MGIKWTKAPKNFLVALLDLNFDFEGGGGGGGGEEPPLEMNRSDYIDQETFCIFTTGKCGVRVNIYFCAP